MQGKCCEFSMGYSAASKSARRAKCVCFFLGGGRKTKDKHKNNRRYQYQYHHRHQYQYDALLPCRNKSGEGKFFKVSKEISTAQPRDDGGGGVIIEGVFARWNSVADFRLDIPTEKASKIINHLPILCLQKLGRNSPAHP